MGTTAPASAADMSALLGIPQAQAATAGPRALVPVAFLGRTSNERLQDPIASMRRQVRKSHAWLPAGCQIVAYYWDVESGGDDLEDRGHKDTWQVAAAAGIPRDGSVSDLLTEAKSPTPDFAFVVCENIERSARDTYNALKLERELQDQGIPLFATDEPFSVEGINATTVLVRRVKQGVAEWFRLQLKDAVWSGLREHSLAGWNLGKVPLGYLGERHPHPNPIKAAEGRAKTRLAPDPVYAPVVSQIYKWRVSEHLGKPTIRARLAADPITYPPPGNGWSLAIVDEILSNPKYTGYQVMGRRRRKAGTKLWMPASEWIWSAEPTHDALVDKATWDEAQRIGRRHGNARDPETPTRRTGRRYKLRSRLYCSICHRRLSGTTIRSLTYYRCPHEPGLPRHYAAYPDHRTVAIREEVMLAALARFFTERVFGPDRAAMLTAHIPASAAAQEQRRHAKAEVVRRKLAKIDTAETALITELETPADPADRAAQALRQRIRARFTELYAQRTTLETELAALEAAAPATQDDDPTLLDELPALGSNPDQRPGQPDRTAPGRLRRPGHLQPGQAPGHHPRHHHRRYPPNRP